jgi:hypothetical protein
LALLRLLVLLLLQGQPLWLLGWGAWGLLRSYWHSCIREHVDRLLLHQVLLHLLLLGITSI